MPDGDRRRKAFEQALARVVDWKESTFTFGALITFTRFESFHQANLRTVCKRDLLMATADSENRLTCLLDDIEHSRQRLRSVLLPRMTLATQNDVRGFQAADTLERNAVKRLGEDLQTGNQTTQHRPNLTRAGALTVNCVVDEVNEQSYFKQ